jgi:HAD superfamily 5'-nucleotidase-like hydrolase
MIPSNSDDLVHAIRPLDLAAIDAVGFDLDHTLALYDDQAVNVLAAEETVSTLKIRGYAPASLPVEISSTVARGLSMDLRHGNVLKIGADGRVRLARRGVSWLSDREIEIHYAGHNPADEADTWHVHSPFDAPTLWFFSALGPGIRDRRDTAYAARLLRDIRTSLDESHTRGELKKHIARELGRFVSPAGTVREGLERWKRSGKLLFVVTNSDRAFAGRVLDHVLGTAWRSIFDVVITDAGKPSFFSDAAPQRRDRERADAESGVDGCASAAQVEARLGVPAGRILYAGDNARADVIPARRRGWKAVHVVAELAGPPAPAPWAGALVHDGAPTWFARTIHDHADAACARIDALLALDPHTALYPGTALYDHITRRGALSPRSPDVP